MFDDVDIPATNLTWTIVGNTIRINSTLGTTSTIGTFATLPQVTNSNPGLMSSVNLQKLDNSLQKDSNLNDIVNKQ